MYNNMHNKVLINKACSNTIYLPVLEVKPTIHPGATVRNSELFGDVTVDEGAHVVNAVLRADEGTPFYIGKGSNIQDFCILHGYTARDDDKIIEENLVCVDGKFYSIYISNNVSASHAVLIHGPSFIGENSFIGFKSTIDAASVGKNSEIGAHCYIRGVNIPDNTAILPGSIITKQDDIEKYSTELTGINYKISKVNHEMAAVYNRDFSIL